MFSLTSSQWLQRSAAMFVLGALLTLPGCSRVDPLGTLRKFGCEIKKEGVKVASVNFPANATDEEVENLATKRFRDVQSVNLAGTKVTDEGLKHLAKLDQLQVLNLSRTEITDAGLEHLKGLTSLRSLSLGDTKVSDEAVEALKELPQLQLLDLAHADKPTQPEERTLGSTFRLGIDLAGGANIVLQVDHERTEKEITDDVMDRMVGAIIKRVNPSGTEEVTVRRVGVDRIELIIPDVDREETQAFLNKVTRLGSLEFAILANRNDHADIIRDAEKLTGRNTELRRPGRGIVAGWRKVAVRNGIPKDISGHGQVVSRPVEDSEVPGQREFLVVFEPVEKRVTGRFLVRTQPSTDQTGEPVVSFTFNGEGGRRFFALTRKNGPTGDDFHRRLAILLDEQVESAPQLNEPISTQGQISGRFTQEEVQELVNVLNAGALEVPLKPTPVRNLQVEATLGEDVRKKGVMAITVASIIVVAFMFVYYMFAGIVANACLCLNILLIMGTMTFINATFTLPGLAGLVLTIGMAVDANVLIFERIREERSRGSSMRMSIQNGFGRAFTTIVDANVTTLLTAVVLYLIGTDQIRGFAVTLFIGIVMSMFSALYFGRLLFDLAERNRWIKDLKMMSIVGKTEIGFVSKQRAAAFVSCALIVIGLGALTMRGSDVLDIDFTGGTMLTMQFEEDNIDVDVVEEKLAEKLGSAVVEEITIETENGTKSQYQVRTSMRDADNDSFDANTENPTVTELVSAAFEGTNMTLVKVTMNDVTDIESLVTEEGEDEETAVAAYDPSFEGGHRSKLSFSKGIARQTAIDRFDAAVRTLKKDSIATFTETAGLFDVIPVEGSGVDNEYTAFELYSTSDLEKDDLVTALGSMQGKLAATPLFESVNSFDSQVAAEMQTSAMMAMLASLVAIVAYIWFRFQNITFGLAAVVALVHDVLVVLGLVALASWFVATTGMEVLGLVEFKINLPMIAAFLTIVGYSLNDTIVVFDRIREVRGKNPALTNEMVDRSLNQTLSRTLLTSITTFLVVAILYSIGGEGIHGFAYCLVLGVIVGTYSSVFVASPTLLWLMNREAKLAGSSTPASTAPAAT